jgi:NDP-sugar pyrophosphorylase family protein
VTDAADLLALNMHYLMQDAGQSQCESPLPAGTQLLPPVVIESGVEIGAGSVLGPALYVEQGARIGRGARVQKSLVLRGAEVGVGQSLSGEIVAPLGLSVSNIVAPKEN